MSNELVTITRSTVKRAWNEFEPKVITGLLSGATGAAIISFLPTLGIHTSDALNNFIIVGCYFLGSYLTPSGGMVVTTNNPNGEVVTKTTGHTVTTATASVPIIGPATISGIAPAAPPTPVQASARAFLDHLPSANTEPVEPADVQPTEVLPNTNRGWS